MADENTIIIEERMETLEDLNTLDNPPLESEISETLEENPQSNKKKKIMVGVAIGLLLVIIGGGIVAYMKFKAPSVEHNATIPEKNKTHVTLPKAKSLELEEIIQKANLLYQKGDKQAAIALYNQIESISYYNLGVAKMQDENFDEAIEAFTNSIRYENYFVPATINMAICSLRLGDEVKFKMYLKSAKERLGDLISSPLYSYYYALIAYYEGRNIESLAAINNPTSDNYYKENQAMALRMYTMMGDDIRALHHVLNLSTVDNEFTKGLLQSRLGKYDQAIISLTNAMKYGQEYNKAAAALALVHFKSTNYIQGAKLLSLLAGQNELQNAALYPIRVQLHPNVFLINPFQQEFFGFFQKNAPKQLFDAIFYYSPYKMNAGRALASSGVNAKLTLGLRNAAEGRLSAATKIFEKVAKEYRGSTVVRYNLGLAMAHNGRYDQAYRNFFWSYQLDPKNYLAGALAILTGKLINVDVSRIVSSLKKDSEARPDNDIDAAQARAIIYLSEENWGAASRFFDLKKEDRLSCFLDTLIASKVYPTQVLTPLEKLKKTGNDDLVTQIYDVYVRNKNRPPKDLAFLFQQVVKSGKYNHQSIYFGPAFGADMERNIARATGLLPLIENGYKEALIKEHYEQNILKNRLGLIQFFQKKFVEAHANFSTLSEKATFVDKETLFLASLASLAIGKNSDALMYLELIRFMEPDNKEARLGIALLKHEARNLKDAAIHYEKLGDAEWRSGYFDFQVIE